MTEKKIARKKISVAEGKKAKKSIPKKAKNVQSDSSKIQKKYAKSMKKVFKYNASQLKYEASKNVVDPYGLNTAKFMKQLINAVKLSHDFWCKAAYFQNVTINGITAIGSPGCLDGPELSSFDKKIPALKRLRALKNDLAYAVLNGASANFKLWQDAVTVPGLPWYPSFAVIPGPVAPPTPNIPFPVIACASSQLAKILIPSAIENTIQSHLSDTLKKAVDDTFLNSLALKLSLYFSKWVVSQLVQNVIGTGPVPTFAPPYVPNGPVYNGSIIATPGHLAY